MMKHNKSVLMLGGAVTALLAFSAVSSASAFDRVHWSWYQHVHEDVDIDVTIDPGTLVPTGLVDLEKLQVFIGDVSAVSVVKDITNNQPSGSNDNHNGDHNQWPFNFNNNHDNNHDNNGGPLAAATELPSLTSAATAVGNNQSISTDVAVTLHDGQFLFGGFNCNFGGDGVSGVPYTGNSNLSAALALVYAGSDGLISSSNIEAKSIVENIENVAVDSNATAVGNNTNVDIAYAPDTGNGVLIGDITQVAYADVSAKSIVKDVTLSNYTGLAGVSPIVNSTATAVGNNVNITVKAATP